MSFIHRTLAAAAILLLVLIGTLGSRESVEAQSPTATLTVDAKANVHPINPLIYGVANATADQLKDLNFTLNRSGGNNTSRYNWMLNGDNRANDFYYESLADASPTEGERADTFISNTQGAGAQPMVTIPLLDWVARFGPNRGKLCSFSQAKYGAQTGSDAQYFPDAGNGILKSNNQPVVNNDPNDANVRSDSAFQQDWVKHLVGRWGTAGNGGLRYYIMDNESSIWHKTHRDVHPTGAKMDEIRLKILDYAAKVKEIDPSALIVGPEEWGWSGYRYSGYDQQYGEAHGWSNLPDRAKHGGMNYLPWLLDQIRQHDTSSHQRLLDVFSVHYYPQGGEFSDDTSPSMQLRRNRSTRSLWDPNYVDESWINTQVQLIPRLRRWVNTYYPGTKIALTEYNWGAEKAINGATAQADILGILGREGPDMAARWETPDPSTPTYKAMKLYRNYDGNKSAFGETSVGVTSSANPDNLSAFAAARAGDGSLTLMVVNKALSASRTITVKLANFTSGGAAQPRQLTSANSIVRLSDVSVSGSQFTTTLPPQSITLFVLPNHPAQPQFTATVTASYRIRKIRPDLTLKVTCDTAPLSNGIVDVEVYNDQGGRDFQKFWDGQSIATGETRQYRCYASVPFKGVYEVKVGIFGANWTPTLYWNGAALQLEITRG
jgi:hypothetical protein